MDTKQMPTEADVISWMDSLSNWGRWGVDDQLGTLNLITDTKRAQAASLVKEGISVTCARLIVPEIAARSHIEHLDGVIARAMPQGDITGFAPPFCITRAEVDTVVAATADAVKTVLG